MITFKQIINCLYVLSTCLNEISSICLFINFFRMLIVIRQYQLDGLTKSYDDVFSTFIRFDYFIAILLLKKTPYMLTATRLKIRSLKYSSIVTSISFRVNCSKLLSPKYRTALGKAFIGIASDGLPTLEPLQELKLSATEEYRLGSCLAVRKFTEQLL